MEALNLKTPKGGNRMERKKVYRLLVYEGDADWIDTTIKTSHIKPDKPLEIGSCTIKEIMRDQVEVDEEGKEVKN